MAVGRFKVALRREVLRQVLAVSGDHDRVRPVAEAGEGDRDRGTDADGHVGDDVRERVGDMEDNCLRARVLERDRDGAVVRGVVADRSRGGSWDRMIAINREADAEIGWPDLDGDRVGTIGETTERAGGGQVGADRDVLHGGVHRVGDVEDDRLTAGVGQCDYDLAIAVDARGDLAH